MGSSLVYLQETLNPILKVNNTKIDISKLHTDYDSYVLTNNDKNRIKPLKDTVRDNDITFKFFITISPYNFIPNNASVEHTLAKKISTLKLKSESFISQILRVGSLLNFILTQPLKIMEDCIGTY